MIPSVPEHDAAAFCAPQATLTLLNVVESGSIVAEHAVLQNQIHNTLATDLQRRMSTLAGAHRDKWNGIQTTSIAARPPTSFFRRRSARKSTSWSWGRMARAA
jgi:hypothetical protein